MKKIIFPYGNGTIDLDVADNTPILTSEIDKLKSERDGSEIVKEAMAHPIGSPRLFELAKGKPDCCIIISDHTRPVPSKDILPFFVSELRQGNPDIKITFLVATGFHRATTEAELRNKLGDAMYEEFKDNIVVHDAHDPKTNGKIGVLPSGPDCIIDKAAIDTSLLIAEGFIEPHTLAGFSGGRKSILPGICDAVTVMGNHCGKFIADPFVRQGVLDHNPMHEDMVAAAQMAKLAFICNVVIDEEKKTVAAFAGEFNAAHRAGCDFISRYCIVKPAYADIVISTNGGYPLDQNAYQCVKGMSAAEATIKDGGIVIFLAKLSDGHGGEHFFNTIKEAATADACFQNCVNTPQTETKPDQWSAQLWCRVVRKYRVFFVADPSQKEMVENLKVEYFATVQEALCEAYKIKGNDATLTCIPNGLSVVVRD